MKKIRFITIYKGKRENEEIKYLITFLFLCICIDIIVTNEEVHNSISLYLLTVEIVLLERRRITLWITLCASQIIIRPYLIRL